MRFKDRLKDARLKAGLTQAELAEKVSVTARTIQNYEMGTRKPNSKIVAALAAALGTTVDYLLSSADVYTLTAQEKGGARAARDIEELVSEVTGLFAGGQLSEDALEGAMRALNDAYWQAKEKNKSTIIQRINRCVRRFCKRYKKRDCIPCINHTKTCNGN